LLIGGQGSGEFEDRRQRTLHIDRQGVHDLGGGAGGHRRDLLHEGSELVAMFDGLLEPGERSLAPSTRTRASAASAPAWTACDPTCSSRTSLRRTSALANAAAASSSPVTT